MARENPSWREERIANELLLKLGLRVSPRTVQKYWPKVPAAPAGNPRRDQRWVHLFFTTSTAYPPARHDDRGVNSVARQIAFVPPIERGARKTELRWSSEYRRLFEQMNDFQFLGRRHLLNRTPIADRTFF